MTNAEYKLKTYVDDFFESLELYDDYHNGHNYKDLLKASIDVFFENENTYTAYDIYDIFFMIYQITPEDKSEEKKNDSELISASNTLIKLADIMKKYEANTGDLIEKQRDHFIHSVNVFLLGLAIYSQNSLYREYFTNYIINSKYEKYYKLEDNTLSNEEFLYRWGVAALFHDIGYPVEIIGKQLTKFIDDGLDSISDDYDVNPEINFKNFKAFNSIVKEDPHFTDLFRNDYPYSSFINLYKPTDIMAYKINQDFGVDINELINHLDNFPKEMGEGGFIDHGFFSAILVMNSYGSLMQSNYTENDKSEKYAYFFYPIVDSTTAILLHNYYRNAMQKIFKQKQLDPKKSPLSYLLILCDELQEWNRRPIGIKDKQKSHVNEINLEITENNFLIEYIIKGGTVGLGFKEEKKKLLIDLLNIDAIFDQFDVKVDVKLDLENPMKRIIPSETEAPDVLLRNIEKIAEKVHENFSAKEQGKDEKGNIIGFIPYNELPASYKKSNIRQAKSYPYKLNMIGCEIVSSSDERIQTDNKFDIKKQHKFTDTEIEDLAIVEHKDWCNEKDNTGWISHHVAYNLGLINEETYIRMCESNKEPVKEDSEGNIIPYDKFSEEDKLKYQNPNIEPLSKYETDDLKVHSNLVDWDELNEETKDKDRDPIRAMPENLNSLDLYIVKTRLRLLTMKMHETFRKEYINLGIEEFANLTTETKYSNYKQTSFLVKLLSENKYFIVSKCDKGEPVEEFMSNEIEHFAKSEHNNWYKRKVQEGWTKGERDEEKKKNPNMDPWEKLNTKTKEANRFTFENLPQSCKKVGLKIIKKEK